MDKVLKILERQGIRAVAYADDLVILSPGFCLSTVSQMVERGIKVVSNWSENCGLNVSPEKTELVLFTRKTKNSEFCSSLNRGDNAATIPQCEVSRCYLGRKIKLGTKYTGAS